SYRMAQQMMWQAFQLADRQSRARVLGLSPAPLWGPFGSERMRQAPVLYGYSPAVIPPPPDWEGRAIVTGYWMAAPDEAWEPPSDLARFLEGGDPPVYVGFGSMSSRHPEQTADLVLGALARTGRRGIVLSGWGGIVPSGVSASVYVLDGAPFGWLFPRMAAVVHHGGAGTTAEGMRAGVPSVIVPFFGDQPFWGRRVAALGVGPSPIPRRRLTIDNLAAAIEEACSDGAMRECAKELGARIQAENGVARAVEAIEGLYPVR
ncbi:MAG: glycosyltransferase, partial [Anaerolineae bacterium]